MSDIQRRKPVEWAVSERGREIRHSVQEVDLALKLMALNGGKTMVTETMLLAENIRVHRNTLRVWRDETFPRRYAQIRAEMGQEVTEEVAGRALERALEADDATHAYIKEAKAKVGQVSPAHLAKNAQALANAESQLVQTAQLLRDRPTSITEDRSLGDLVGTLVKLGVAEADGVIDGEVVGEEDV